MLDRASLRPLLAAYLDGEMRLFDFRGRFYSGHIRPADEVESGLYQMISMHLAMYTAGSWPESELKAAITWHIARAAGEDVPLAAPMWDQQWSDMIRSGLAPWPITLTGHPTEGRD